MEESLQKKAHSSALAVEMNTSPIKPTEINPSVSDMELSRLKVKLRFEVLGQISNLFSILAAVDVKYSQLAQSSISFDTPSLNVDEEKANPLFHAFSSENGPPMKVGEMRGGSPLVSFLLDEFRSGVDKVEAFIVNLDEKYEMAAQTVMQRMENLAQENVKLRAEVDRLRRVF